MREDMEKTAMRQDFSPFVPLYTARPAMNNVNRLVIA